MADIGQMKAAEDELHYAAVAALAFMTWDVLVHISVEVECIWSGPHSWVKWMYAFIRYCPLLHGVLLAFADLLVRSTGLCRAWLVYELAFMEALTIATEIILTIRLYFLYNENKAVLRAIALAFVAEIAIMILVLCLSIPKIGFVGSKCLIANTPNLFMAYWLSSLVFEAFLFCLTIFAFSRSILRNLGRRSVLFLFVRDGTWAFAIIFVSMLTTTLMYKLFRDPRAGVGYFWTLAVMSFAGSHVLLNIRRLKRQDSFSSEALSDVEWELQDTAT